MTEKTLHMRQVAVLGAGVMGAQIAAHLANAGIRVFLFELAADGADRNRLVREAIQRLGKLKPAPLADAGVVELIVPANYEEHLPLLAECDLVIEAIAERMDWKKDLYGKVVPNLRHDAILATNTSGLSIDSLAAVLPPELRPRFCGVHFFNPPRYMHLAELIPGSATSETVMDRLETFLTSGLGKGVVRAKDTPNFIGNRIGVFSMLSAMHHTEACGLDFDVVDQLTGPLIGRPRSATYRTADVVGLDTMAHVIGTMADTLPQDPWHRYFVAPDWLRGLIDDGRMGQKSGAGIYRKQGKTIEVLDRASGEYRESGKTAPPEVIEILKLRDAGERLRRLRDHDSAEARFLWACFRDLFHYCACHLRDIADSARDVDLAMRWGYGYRQGPFESWQEAGWQQVAEWVAEDIAAGRAMAAAELPPWIQTVGDGVHRDGQSYAPAREGWIGRSALPVYDRQPFPEPLLGERFERGHTLFEDDAVRVWHQDDGVAVLSFRTKMHTVSSGVISGMHRAIEIAESDFDALVIWQDSEPFCVGADLASAGHALNTEGPEAIAAIIDGFQRANVRLRTSMVPTVAAVRGMALGGGCEILLHCDRVVAALESYIGLVEAGVGLLPGGGGLAEIAHRAAKAAGCGDLFAHLKPWFEAVAMGKVAGSALEARQMGFLTGGDVIVMHPHELLHAARATARGLADAGYRPRAEGLVPVAGRIGIANLQMVVVNMLEGRFISEHDAQIAHRIATVLCGGDVERGSEVDRRWLLDLEREHFLALIQTAPTQARIEHMLKTGKPLRN